MALSIPKLEIVSKYGCVLGYEINLNEGKHRPTFKKNQIITPHIQFFPKGKRGKMFIYEIIPKLVLTDWATAHAKGKVTLVYQAVKTGWGEHKSCAHAWIALDFDLDHDLIMFKLFFEA